MKIRDLVDDDIPRLKKLYEEQGWKYHFPDLNDGQFIVKRVVVDDNDALVNCVVARKTVELYFFGDKSWRSPKWREQMLAAIHEDVRYKLKDLGYHDGHCWPPPEIAKALGRRLMKMFGWAENKWPCFSREV